MKDNGQNIFYRYSKERGYELVERAALISLNGNYNYIRVTDSTHNDPEPVAPPEWALNYATTKMRKAWIEINRKHNEQTTIKLKPLKRRDSRTLKPIEKTAQPDCVSELVNSFWFKKAI